MHDHPRHHHRVGGLLHHLLQRRLHVILVGNLLDLIWYLLPAALGHRGEGIGRQPGGSGLEQPCLSVHSHHAWRARWRTFLPSMLVPVVGGLVS